MTALISNFRRVRHADAHGVWAAIGPRRRRRPPASGHGTGCGVTTHNHRGDHGGQDRVAMCWIYTASQIHVQPLHEPWPRPDSCIIETHVSRLCAPSGPHGARLAYGAGRRPGRCEPCLKAASPNIPACGVTSGDRSGLREQRARARRDHVRCGRATLLCVHALRNCCPFSC